MLELTEDFIRDQVADSRTIYFRGEKLYENGAYCCTEADGEKGSYVYEVDGNYGDYTIAVRFTNGDVSYSCNCPYPGEGCKHTVAVLLDIMDRVAFRDKGVLGAPQPDELPVELWLSPDEIRLQAIEDRKKRAKSEGLEMRLGEMYKGEHLVETIRGIQYTVTLHDPESGLGHCNCPDFLTNRLGTCKHLIALTDHIKRQKDLSTRLQAERFPFVDIYWDSVRDKPRLFCERPEEEMRELGPLLRKHFDSQGLFASEDLADFLPLLSGIQGNKRFRVQEPVLARLDGHLMERQLEELSGEEFPSLQGIRATLYPYQEKGVRFGLFKKAVLIGDEMGLGKTLQAITLGVLKKEVFGFNRVLVVTLASLKEQWKREIERFTDEKAVVVGGGKDKRQAAYHDPGSLFKITNYEAVLRDVTFLSRVKPDLVILDEAQRIKNFATKTAEAAKSIPRKHSIVLTGTPLENKLEDVYSIVQFLDPHLLAPLWRFAADHFMLSRDKKGKILGYRNLTQLHDRLQGIVIRRRKEEVLSELPEEVVNNYYVDLSDQQLKIHNGYLSSLLPLMNKKFLTPMDLRRIQELLLKMRMVCNSTYLIDRKTNISPKMKELESILDELVVENGRKLVIFSEWTTMTYLVGKHLSQSSIPFVELSGKVPVVKRQALIDEFTTNSDCKVFLSTDAGGTGLNLQAADCVINFELPWNPARLSQRVGRVSRIGQRSQCVNVVNLIAKNSIEEKIMAGLQLKRSVFEGVFDGGPDTVEFSHEKRAEIMNKLREMMGDEPIAPTAEQRPAEELPEDTPYYLNPQVLQEKPEEVAYEAEEAAVYDAAGGAEASEEAAEAAATTEAVGSVGEGRERPPGTSPSQAQSPERLEEVMNSGLHFISGLLEMATGQKLSPLADDQKMIQVDKATGEVTMKFKLPGF
jgi:superfamily II DNA or RNA helicase